MEPFETKGKQGTCQEDQIRGVQTSFWLPFQGRKAAAGGRNKACPTLMWANIWTDQNDLTDCEQNQQFSP